MKKYSPYLVFLLLALVLFLSACERSQSTPPPEAVGPSPTAGVLTQLPDAIASQTAAPTAAEVIPTEVPPNSTEVPAEPTEEPTEEPPTPTDEPETGVTLVPKDQPTKTLEPTSIPQGEAFDPTETYGTPTYMDPMNASNSGNWKSGGSLPTMQPAQGRAYADRGQDGVAASTSRAATHGAVSFWTLYGGQRYVGQVSGRLVKATCNLQTCGLPH